MQEQALNLDLSGVELRVEPFTHEGKRYFLKEASGEAGMVYRKALMKLADFDDNGNVNLANLGTLSSLELDMLQHCVFRLKETDEGADEEYPVTRDVLATWPDRLIQTLYKKLREISELSSQGGILGTLMSGSADGDEPPPKSQDKKKQHKKDKQQWGNSQRSNVPKSTPTG